jgi:hypothetical protein
VWLGHHSPAFTLATYVHFLADDLPDVSFFDDVTSGATKRPPGPPKRCFGTLATMRPKFPVCGGKPRQASARRRLATSF